MDSQTDIQHVNCFWRRRKEFNVEIYSMIIPSGMLGSHGTGFIKERMDVTGKGEKNVEVLLQSLIIIYFLYSVSLSAFSTKIVSVGASLDFLISFLYTQQFYLLVPTDCSQSTEMCSLLLSFHFLYDNPENLYPFSQSRFFLLNPGWLVPVLQTLPQYSRLFSKFIRYPL